MGRDQIIYMPERAFPWRVFYQGRGVGACSTLWGARFRLAQVRRRSRKAARLNAKVARRGL